MVEVLVAVIILTVGLLGLVAGFDSARKLTLLSERRTAMAHRAQLELERLQTYPYSELLMISAPAHSTEKNNPDYYVNTEATAYHWDPSNSETETFALASKSTECTESVTSECGLVAASPTSRKCSEHLGACEWKDGQVSGNVYDFVTNHADTNCGATCKYKRLTVVVTATVPTGNHEPAPLRVSTLIAEPG